MMKYLMTILFMISALYAEVKVGDAFPVFNLQDQFDVKMQVPQKGKITLILSFEKDVSSEVKTFINTQKKNYLEDNHIMYISDISPMPSFVTSLFALPKMKKFNFRVALINEDNVADVIPRKDAKVTRIKLHNNHVQSIEFVVPKMLGK